MSPAVVDRLVEWAVPSSSLDVPPITARSRVDAYLREIRIEVPNPEPFALRWRDYETGFDMIPASEAIEDEDLVITPDPIEVVDVVDTVLYLVNDTQRTFPGPLSWRRWSLTGKVSSWLYISGITASGGSFGWDGADPIRSIIYELPSWRSLLGRRCYVLFLPMWWWRCQRSQRFALRGRHRPARPFCFGICARCVPCPECGEPYDCADTCTITGLIEVV